MDNLLLYYLQFLLLSCSILFGTSLVLCVRSMIRKDWEQASTFAAMAIMAIFAIIPYFRSGAILLQTVGLPK